MSFGGKFDKFSNNFGMLKLNFLTTVFVLTFLCAGFGLIWCRFGQVFAVGGAGFWTERLESYEDPFSVFLWTVGQQFLCTILGLQCRFMDRFWAVGQH